MKSSRRKILITSGALIVLILSGAYISQKTDVVEVKYSGNQVDLSEYENLDTSKSSFVQSAWYDRSGETMVLKLNDEYYQYCDLPADIWLDFSNAESFGKFYNSTIKDSYQCIENADSSNQNESSNSVSGIESSPYYESCLSESIKEGDIFLSSQGYSENDAKSWTDANGKYPTSEIETQLEGLESKALFDCLGQ